MIGVSRLLFCLLVTHFSFCCVVASSISTLGLDFEDCGGVIDAFSVDLNSCTKVPCQVEREKFARFEVVFDPNDSPGPINLLKFEAFWIFDGITHSATTDPIYCNSVNCLANTGNGLLRLSAGVYVPSSLPRMGGFLYWKTINYYSGIVLMCNRIAVYIY